MIAQPDQTGAARTYPSWAHGRAAEFKERFAEVFGQIADDAVLRENERILPYDHIEALRSSGFTKLTVPVEFGGLGAGIEDLFEVLAHLAQHDSNISQIFRSHFAFVDRTTSAPPSARRERNLRLVAGGAIFGNASHERSSAEVGSLSTRVGRSEGGLVLDGTKYYSTGTLFADWVSVSAQDEDGAFVGVTTPTSAPGVTRVDDWRGFGQRLTGSGTTIFEQVVVGEDDLVRHDDGGPSHGSAFVQLVLLAAAEGIGRAVVSDAVGFVRGRTRAYSHGSAATAREDPIVQELVGELSGLSYSAGAALRLAASALADSSSELRSGDDDGDVDGAGDRENRVRSAIENARLAVTNAQLVVLPAVLKAATLLFEVGGASATDSSLALDRHWRNARTLASHNPVRYKSRSIGDVLINGRPLVDWWSTGEAKARPTHPEPDQADPEHSNAEPEGSKEE